MKVNRKKLYRFIAIMIVAVLAFGLIPMISFAQEVSHTDLQDNDTAAPEAWGALPSSNQLKYQQDELAAFCHFGMNTFTNVEWGSGNESPAQFNLQNDFDAETLVKTIYDAGFKKLIITAKHHDGFCIWPSEYTGHDVAGSPYKNGEGDILAEISAECTKYDLDMGLYLSPWDANAESYGYYDANGRATTKENDVLDYNDYYVNQIIEIASNPKYGNNGRFVEWWMDGAKGSGADAQEYDFVRWFDTIQQYQGKAAGYDDDCMLFGAGAYTTVRWIGNENGFAHNETWSKSKVNYDNNSINSNSSGGYSKGFADGNQWTVPESDARITPGWFWHPNQQPKTMEQLSEMYFRSVGHNSPLLLNIPPNNQGTVDTAIVDRTLEFGSAIQRMYATNYAARDGVGVTASSVRGNSTSFSPNNVLDGNADTYWTMDDGQTTGSITIDLGVRCTFDVVSIQEHIALGQRISGYTVEYKDGDKDWKVMESGPTIGGRRLVRTSPVKADKVRITVTESNAVPLISEIGIYKADGGFEIGTAVPDDLEFIDNVDFATTGTWSPGTTGLEESNMYTNVTGNTASFDFTGSKFWIVANADPSHGIAAVLVDGEEIDTFDTYKSARETSKIVYESPTLEHGAHTVTIKVTGQKNASSSNRHIDLDGAYVLNNNGAGMFEIEQDKYSVVAGDSIDITVKRTGGSTGAVSVFAGDNPGGAVQGQYYENFYTEVEFADGETEKTVTVNTFVNSEHTGDLDFYIELVNPSGGAVLGFNTYSQIILKYYKDELKELLGVANTMEEHQYRASGWAAFAQARDTANGVYGNEGATYEQFRAAAADLGTAMDALEKFDVFTEADPFVLPAVENESSTLEAEYFTLVQRVPGEEPNATNKNVRLSSNAGASNGLEVNWFETGNQIKLPYVAEASGVYEFTARFRSGRDESKPNVFSWSGDNIEPGYKDVWGPEASTFRTVTFDVTITQPGAGWLVLDATSKAGPVIDKFDITLKEADEVQYTVSASAGEGGSISPSGEVKVAQGGEKPFVITADEGYAIKDVKVNGESVGAVAGYTFSDVQANATIEAEFEFGYYTAQNPFELPAKGGEANAKTVEGEHFALYPRVPGEEPNSTNKNVRISANAGASNGFELNWFEDGNTVKLPYVAAAAGTYEFTATYRSGRAASSPNVISWSGENITAGSVDVYGPEQAVFRTVKFEVEITQAGAGEFVLEATSKAGPVIDKFDIVFLAEEPGDSTLLQEVYDSYKEQYTDGSAYTTGSWNALEDAMDAAKDVLDNDKALQGEIDDALQALQAAAGGLSARADNDSIRLLQGGVTLAEQKEQSGASAYTEASWADFAQQLAQARAMLDDTAAYSGAEMQQAYTDLQAATKALVRVVNKEYLAQALAAAEEMLLPENVGSYIPASVANLETAVQAAKATMENASAMQEEIYNSYANLAKAIHDMFEKGDKNGLQSLVNLLSVYTEGEFTPASWAPFNDAMQNARAVLADENALQEAIDSAATRLLDAMDGLVYKADKVALNAVVLQAQAILANADNYVASTLQGLQGELNKATAVLNDENASQSGVDAAWKALNDKVLAARMKADKSQLLAALKTFKALNLNLYTQASVNALTTLATEAEKLLEVPDDSLRQKDLDDMTQKLLAAISGLEIRQNEQENGGGTINPPAAGQSGNNNGGGAVNLPGGTSGSGSSGTTSVVTLDEGDSGSADTQPVVEIAETDTPAAAANSEKGIGGPVEGKTIEDSQIPLTVGQTGDGQQNTVIYAMLLLCIVGSVLFLVLYLREKRKARKEGTK